jgi:hypothetical protein
MATRGFLAFEAFARVGGLWQSLGVRTITATSDSSGIETFDRTLAFPCPSAIGDAGGTNEFRIVRVGFGNSSSTDYLTGFPSVTWQVDGTSPTETAISQSLPLKIMPANG